MHSLPSSSFDPPKSGDKVNRSSAASAVVGVILLIATIAAVAQLSRHHHLRRHLFSSTPYRELPSIAVYRR
jgi:hypothetical protein